MDDIAWGLSDEAEPIDVDAKTVSVCVCAEAWRSIEAHVGSNSTEEGGVLLGHVELVAEGARVVVERALAAESRDAGQVHFAFRPDTWSGIRAQLTGALAGLSIVGWYHSHPDLGAYFSGTDRTTQAGCFTAPWSVGLVVDPVRREAEAYVGPESVPAMAMEIEGVEDIARGSVKAAGGGEVRAHDLAPLGVEGTNLSRLAGMLRRARSGH